MKALHKRCAGLDVHKAEVLGCLRVVTNREVGPEVRRFPTTTQGLLALTEWLGVRDARMWRWKELRDLTRTRKQLTREIVQHVQRIQAVHIKGEPKVMLEQKGAGAEQLIRIAWEEHADLLVTCGYLGEWIFGGMTRELVTTSSICCLMSH